MLRCNGCSADDDYDDFSRKMITNTNIEEVEEAEEDLEILISLVASQIFLKTFLERVSVAAEDLEDQIIEAQILDMIYL